MAFLPLLGMLSGSDCAGGSLLIYGCSVGERLCLRITPRGNNSVARGGILLEDFADSKK